MLKHTLWTPGLRDPTETETELCLSVSCGGTGHQWSAARTGALGVGMAYILLEEVTNNPTTELPELTQDLEMDSWRAQQNFVHQDPEGRNSDPTGDCPGLACKSLGLWQRRGLVVACYRVGGMDCSSTCMGSFEGDHHYLHHLYHSLAPGK